MQLSRVIGKGDVMRVNIADVEISNNTSRLIFRENVTVNTLWTGTFSYKEHNTMQIQWSLNYFRWCTIRWSS